MFTSNGLRIIADDIAAMFRECSATCKIGSYWLDARTCVVTTYGSQNKLTIDMEFKPYEDNPSLFTAGSAIVSGIRVTNPTGTVLIDQAAYIEVREYQGLFYRCTVVFRETAS